MIKIEYARPKARVTRGVPMPSPVAMPTGCARSPCWKGLSMKLRNALRAILSISLVVGCIAASGNKDFRRISISALEDKIHGGWAGQMIGASYGAPTEFRAMGRINDAELSWSPERVSNSISQDDLYVEMTFAEVMDRIGLNATSKQYGDMFKNSKYSLWHANAAARRLLNQGIDAPMSGHPKYNAHADDIDFQIESDFIGLMTPGLPREANKFCERAGRVMNYGDGLYGGMFFGGMYSAAYFDTDVRRVVEQGLACIPLQSKYGKIIRDLLDWSAKYPDDWRKTWQLIEDKWDIGDVCPDGALQAFNIDASINGAYVALGLLYGKGDFSRTVEIATRAGQDSDCNPSSAAGILGVMLGYEKIPDLWKSGIPRISDIKFQYTNYSYSEICKSTLDRALLVIKQSGGKVEGNEILVPFQKAKPARLEQWNPGIPDKRIDIKDPAWNWKGNWTDDPRGSAKAANGTGAEVSLNFTGTALFLLGSNSQSGGRADVYVDGRRKRILDAYIVERTNDNVLWHVYGLKQGAHTLRIVTRDDADPRSKGKTVAITGAVILRPSQASPSG
jgi:hypothetical protein